MDRQTDMKYQAPGDTSNPNANDVNDKQKEVKCTDLDLKQIGGFKDDFIKVRLGARRDYPYMIWQCASSLADL